MQWGYLILALAGSFSTGVSFHLHKKTGSLKFLGLFWASLLFVAVSAAYILQPVLTDKISSFLVAQVIEWGHVYCLALILSSLLLFVRDSKPEFSRFPITYVSFPLLIVLSYLLIYNTVILKNWLINIYQGGAVVVTMLIYGIYNYRESIYLTVFMGSVLFFITFLIYLLLPQSYIIVWQVLLAISIGTLFSGYLIIDREFKDNM